ncbi:MAG: LysR family transcriptional regulator [Clostridia bacterium]|nr:LysR family transcriptional regulator [Clostridia bacterium]
METEYVRQFALLAKECHFQAAAELLYINQSTLSKHIAALEKELGQMLFYRTTRQVQLTDFGREFLPYAEKIIGIVNDCDANLISKYKKNSPALHIGVSPFASIRRLMEGKLSCQETVPEIASMVFTETNSAQLRAGLKNGRFQMVIDGIGPLWEEGDFAAVPYMQDHLCVLLAAEHSLAQKENLSLDEVRNLSYIHLYTETNTSPFLSDPVLIADTVPQVLGAVSEGKGYSILPYERVKKHLPGNVRAIRLTPSPDLQFYAYYLRHAKRSEALAEILKYFAKNT